MPGGQRAPRTAEQFNQSVARGSSTDRRTWLRLFAAVVDFPRHHPGDPDLRSFGAPDLPIAVPDRHGIAQEDRTGGNDLGQHDNAHPILRPVTGLEGEAS